MYGKTIKLFISFILLISVFNISLSETFAQSEKSDKHHLKITFNKTVLFHDEVLEQKYIQVLNVDNEIIKSEILEGDLDLELAQPTIPAGNLLSYWDIQQTDTHLKITPVVVKERDSISTFTAHNGGYLVDNNSQVVELIKTYNNNTLLKDILPEVKPIENYKFRGWYVYSYGSNTELDELDLFELLDLEKVNVTDTTKVEPKKHYQALFYKDINNNDLDDKTEKIRLKFVGNNEQQIDDIEILVGEPFALPKLAIKKNHVFVGWYLDDEYKTIYDSNNPLTTNTTLYAKWEEVEQVIAESEQTPITDENISEQVESILNGRLDKLEAAIQKTANDYAKLSQAQPITQTEEDTSNENENEVLTFTETKYVYNNPHIGKRFLVKFKNRDNEFLFSTLLPYGRTIRVLDQNGVLQNEYAVRQETTITMNTRKLVVQGELLEFDTREVRENSSDITEVFPVLKEPKQINTPVVENVEQKENIFNFKNLLALSILLIVAVAIILFIKKRKRKNNKEMDIHIDSIQKN